MMKKELPYFYIGSSYGGNQEWFSSLMMKLGGCGAETACESCIFLDLYKGTKLYPYDKNHLNRTDYAKFGNVMKPYLRPRRQGIDKLSIYIDGFGAYLKDRKSGITLSGVEGTEPTETARRAVIHQIDNGMPIPFLCLKHANPRFKEYEWHWFILNGYELFEETLMVKAVTYSSWEWLDFDELWNTRRAQKGGFILIEK